MKTRTPGSGDHEEGSQEDGEPHYCETPCTMKIRIEAFGFALKDSPPEGRGHFLELVVDEPIALSDLLEAQLDGEIDDKTVLVNGSYVLPDHLLHEGDVVQILRMLQGG